MENTVSGLKEIQIGFDLKNQIPGAVINKYIG